MRYYLVSITHQDDGYLGRREVTQIPSKGEWIKYNRATYVVKHVIWNYDDTLTVNLIVTELED
jgi:hypothetical protein